MKHFKSWNCIRPRKKNYTECDYSYSYMKRSYVLFIELCNSPYLMRVRLTSWLVGRGKERRRDDVVTLKRPETVPRGELLAWDLSHTHRARTGNTVTRRV